MNTPDILRLAQELVERHGPDAAIQASHQADLLLDEGDLAGYAVWDRIMQAAEQLLAVSLTDQDL